METCPLFRYLSEEEEHVIKAVAFRGDEVYHYDDDEGIILEVIEGAFNGPSAFFIS